MSTEATEKPIEVLESRAVFVITVLDALKGPHFAELIDSVIGTLSASWTAGKGDREDLVTLLDVLGKRGITPADAPFIAARQCLLTEPEPSIKTIRGVSSMTSTAGESARARRDLAR